MIQSGLKRTISFVLIINLVFLNCAAPILASENAEKTEASQQETVEKPEQDSNEPSSNHNSENKHHDSKEKDEDLSPKNDQGNKQKSEDNENINQKKQEAAHDTNTKQKLSSEDVQSGLGSASDQTSSPANKPQSAAAATQQSQNSVQAPDPNQGQGQGLGSCPRQTTAIEQRGADSCDCQPQKTEAAEPTSTPTPTPTSTPTPTPTSSLTPTPSSTQAADLPTASDQSTDNTATSRSSQKELETTQAESSASDQSAQTDQSTQSNQTSSTSSLEPTAGLTNNTDSQEHSAQDESEVSPSASSSLAPALSPESTLSCQDGQTADQKQPISDTKLNSQPTAQQTDQELLPCSPPPTSTTTLEPKAISPTPTDTTENEHSINLTSTSTPTPTETNLCSTLDESQVANETNQTCLEQNFTANSSTGSNQQQSTESSSLSTGEAQILLDILNTINLKNNGSIYLFSFNQLDKNTKDNLDLNQLWDLMVQAKNSQQKLELTSKQADLVKYLNIAQLTTNINLNADSGHNSSSNTGESLILSTSEAEILVNMVNLINVDFTNSVFLFSAINISDDYSGDIILPRPEKIGSFYLINPYQALYPDQQNCATPPCSSSSEINHVKLETDITASSNTGHNQTLTSSGSNSLATGDANTVINQSDSVNNTYLNSDLYYLLINILGSWTGSWQNFTIYNPGLELGQTAPSNTTNTLTADSAFISQSAEKYNMANVSTNANLSANTGYNHTSTGGDSFVETGDAKIGFNLFNFINDSFYHSRWFISAINVLRNWSGNLILAYPDLSLDLSASTNERNPEYLQLKLRVQNLGQDSAHNSQLDLNLPAQLSLVQSSSNSSGELSPSSSSSNKSWKLNTVNSLEDKTITVAVKLNNPEQITEKTSLPITAQASTSDPEPDYQNNRVQLDVVIDPTQLNKNVGGAKQPATTELAALEPNYDQKQIEIPQLTLSATNNTVHSVSPGDTITFQLILKNEGPGSVENAFINHFLFTTDGSPADSIQFYIGSLPAGKEVEVSFDFVLSSKIVLPAGTYQTLTQAFAYSKDGYLSVSNEAGTSFYLEKAVITNNWLTTAQANANKPPEPEDEKQVLGQWTNWQPISSYSLLTNELLLKLLLLISLSSELAIRWLKAKNFSAVE